MIDKEKLLAEHKNLVEAINSRRNTAANLKKQLDSHIEALLILEGQVIQLEKIINLLNEEPEAK